MIQSYQIQNTQKSQLNIVETPSADQDENRQIIYKTSKSHEMKRVSTLEQLQKIPSTGTCPLVQKFLKGIKKQKHELIESKDLEQSKSGSIFEIKQQRQKSDENNHIKQIKELDNENEKQLNQKQNVQISYAPLSTQILQVRKKQNQKCYPTLRNQNVIFNKSKSNLLKKRKQKSECVKKINPIGILVEESLEKENECIRSISYSKLQAKKKKYIKPQIYMEKDDLLIQLKSIQMSNNLRISNSQLIQLQNQNQIKQEKSQQNLFNNKNSIQSDTQEQTKSEIKFQTGGLIKLERQDYMNKNSNIQDMKSTYKKLVVIIMFICNVTIIPLLISYSLRTSD